MKMKDQIEYVQNMTKFGLLWTILSKSQIVPNYLKVDKMDAFTILASILDLQVHEMVNTHEA